MSGTKDITTGTGTKHLNFLTGNTTAVHSVNNMDSCKSLSSDSELRKI